MSEAQSSAVVQESKTDAAFKQSLLKQEKGVVQRLCTALSTGEEAEAHVCDITAIDLDRKAPAQRAIEWTQSGIDFNRHLQDACATFAAYQEAQRMRRDELLNRQGRKRHLLGCLSSMYQRLQKLTAKVEKLQ